MEISKVIIKNNKNEIELHIETPEITMIAFGSDLEIIAPQIEGQQYFIKLQNRNVVDVPITHTAVWCKEFEDLRQG